MTTCEGIATAEDGRRLRRSIVRYPASETVSTVVIRKTGVHARTSTVVLRRAGAGQGGRRYVDVGYCVHEAYPEYELWRERLTTIPVRPTPQRRGEG